ncbi:MAG: TetR/AcrR family transcriptional regulator [Planctomycetota bacterium]
MIKDNTKDRILDAAEQLFSEQEYAATSLRSITTRAQVNLAAVNYYFGFKKELYQAVISRKVNPINQRRLAMLDDLEAEAGSGPVQLQDILKAFLEPVFNLQVTDRTDRGRFLKLAARAHMDPNPEIQAMFIELFQEIFQRFMKALQRALPGFSKEALQMKFHFMIGSMIHTLHWDQCMDRSFLRKFFTKDRDVLLMHLIRFATEGMRANVFPDVEEDRHE